MPRRLEGAEGRPEIDVARGCFKRGRKRPGGGRRPSARKPADRGCQLRRPGNAARGKQAECRGNRPTLALGRAWLAVAERRRTVDQEDSSGRRVRANRGSAPQLLVVSANSQPAPPGGSQRRLASDGHRPFCAGGARTARPESLAGGRQADAAAAADVRFNGTAPRARRDRALPRQRRARRRRTRGRSLAGIAALRRALGPALARRGPVRRHQGLRPVPGQ